MSYVLPTLPAPAVPDIYEKSAETMNWLRTKIRVGYTDQRGPAWWAAGALTKDGTWDTIPDGSHFDGPVPMEVVLDLLDIPLVKGIVFAQYTDEDGQRQIATDTDTAPIINARTGQIFGYPKQGYKIHPYIETLKGFIDAITDDSDVGVGSVGLLRKDGVAFLQAVLPEHFEVAGYGYQPYLTAVTSADQTRKTTYGTGAKGAVCDNTVDAAVRGALTQLGIRHTRNSGVSVQAAREKLGIQLIQASDVIGDAIRELVEVKVSEKQFGQWLDLAVPLVNPDGTRKDGKGLTMAGNRRDEMTRLWTEDPKAAPWRNTGLGVLQVANTYRTWSGIVKGADGGRMEANFTHDVFGKTAKADTEAMELLAKVLA